MHSSIFSTEKNLIQAIRLLSLFHTLDTSLHNMSLTSDRLSEVLYFTSVWYKQFEIWARNGSLCVLDCERCVRRPPNGFWKVDNLSTGATSFFTSRKLSPNSGLSKSDAIHVVVSPLISLMFFAHSLHSNVPIRLKSNFKILFYSFQFLPRIAMFQKFPITFWFADKMSFFCR